MGDALPRAFQTLGKARVSSCCLSLPWPGTELEAALDLWASHSGEGPERQLLLGDSKQIQRWIATSSSRFPAIHLGAADSGPVALRSHIPDGRISRGSRPE